MRARRWLLRTALAATASTIGLVATGTVMSPASADAPTKVGWWTKGGGAPNPTPDANPGGMRVAVGPQAGVVSYGAVEYSVPEDTTATLELAITNSTPTPPSPSGSPVTFSPLGNIQACPTKEDNWKAGDNQDMATAPAYDCATFHFAGAPSADGKTMTFLLDGAAAQTPGTLSLAIVPVQTSAIYTAGTDAGTDTTPPYYVDFDKPGATSMQLDSSSASPPPPAYTPPPASSGSGAGTTSGGATTPTVTSVTVPSGVGTVTTDTSSGQAPVVATQQPAQNYAAPAAATAPAGPSENRRDLLLVLLILVLFGILYTQNASGGARVPRVLAGPRAAQPPAYPVDPGAAAGVAAGAAVPAAMVAAMMPLMPARGLGRFAKPRSGPARPL
ncbi:MAG: hypothetical protein QOC82_1778, partial [Frankiaceae bacterium]|nr:hypothetical protein [Frankiaceae bacterium]